MIIKIRIDHKKDIGVCFHTLENVKQLNYYIHNFNNVKVLSIKK